MDFDFKEVTSSVKDTMKKIPSWGWVAIVGGVVLLVVMSKRTTYLEPGIVSATKPGGASSQSIGGGDSKSMSAGTDGVLSELTDKVNKMDVEIDTLEKENVDISASFNRVANEFVSYQANTESVIAQTEETFKKYNEKLAYSEVATNIPNIYFDGKNDIDQYTALADSIKASTIRDEDKTSLVQKAAGLGNNGVADPNGGKSYTAAQIKADPTKLKTTVEYTNQVIKNREAAGLDTSVQKSWLNQLTK